VIEDLRLDGRVAVVTGGAMGIGLATARRAAELGARVAVLDLQRGPGEFFFAECDVAESGAVEQALAAVRRELGPVTVLINNAGVAPPAAPFEDLTLESWRKTLAINLDGVFLCTKAALPQFREAGGGAIVNVASYAGRVRSLSSTAAYSASKGGVIAFTRHAAALLIKENVRMNCVCPGAASGAIMDRNMPELERRAALEGSTPIGRMAEPEEVAAVICFLASDASRYMVGQAVDVNGGLL
jgi:NAD(P)-dependent dehydrogenase (short-subunit alcohol dehydrogenase family)